MEFKTLLVEITSSGIAILTMNRPESLNALNTEVFKELDCILHELEQDVSVKVLVLTGSGDKAFVAGADIKEMVGIGSCEGRDFSLQGQRVMSYIEKMKKPVIAAVNGFALGGGLELALSCDFIYASEKAKFGLPEATLGVIPGFGGTQTLSRLIGVNKANELIFTGKMINSQKACEWGIVNEVFAQADLLPKALETAAAIARNGLLAVASAKDAIAHGIEMTKESGFRYEASVFSVLFGTADKKEGMKAFIEKRKPEFKGE